MPAKGRYKKTFEVPAPIRARLRRFYVTGFQLFIYIWCFVRLEHMKGAQDVHCVFGGRDDFTATTAASRGSAKNDADNDAQHNHAGPDPHQIGDVLFLGMLP